MDPLIELSTLSAIWLTKIGKISTFSDQITAIFDYIIRNIKIDAVIGHSLGGYLAYHLSNIKRIPALLFMPSFDDNDIKYITVKTSIKELSIFKEKVILIGKRDKSVNKNKQLSILNNLNISEEDIDHDLTDDIFKKYSKIFIREFIIKK